MGLTGASAGDWFHRLGELEGCVLDLLATLGGTNTTNVAANTSVASRLTNWTTDFASNGTADLAAVGALQSAVASYQSSAPALVSAIATIVSQALVTACNADAPLAALNPTAAVQYLIDKMVAASATINQGTLPAVGAQTAATWVTPVGNPTWLWSVKDSAGRALQYVYPETFTATITADSQTSATAGQEPWTLTGQNAQGNVLAWDWLKSTYGSGSNVQGTLIDPSQSNTAGNLTVNGTFGTWSTTNYPDNWTYVTGVATTNFLNGTATTTYYTAATGIGSLQLLSAGGTKNEVYQKFNTPLSTTAGAGGSPYAFVPSAVNNTQYAVYFAYKLSNASPTNGTLTVRLCDSGGTTITDDQSTGNTTAIDLTAISDTNWHVGSLIIRLPRTLPTTTPYALSFAFTGTILDVGKSVYLGAVGMAVPTQIYAGGPFVVGFRGSTNPNASGTYPDAWTFAITATIGKLQKAMWRYFQIPNLGAQTPGLIIPAVASGSATVADTLVA